MSSHQYIPCGEIPSALGVRAGETVLVASDLTRLAIQAIRNEGRFHPEALLDSFSQTLGAEGTLILPAFNFNLDNGETFNIKKTFPVTGALAKAALSRPDFRRTRHPLHSFLVSGKYTEELVGMSNYSSFGEDSPFSFFRRQNVRMLMIGTSVTEAFTFVHYVEELLKVRYRRIRTLKVNYIGEDGAKEMKRYMIFSKKPGWTMDLAPLEALFRREGFLTDRSVNGITCSSIHLGEAFPVIEDDILHRNARSISHFSFKLYFREILKNTLSSLKLYRTVTEKISHAPGPR